MAARSGARKDDGPTEVTLVGPTGHEVTTSDALSVNNLVYGLGYKPKGMTTDEAAQAVAVDEPAAEV
jgi:hypothetical protein